MAQTVGTGPDAGTDRSSGPRRRGLRYRHGLRRTSPRSHDSVDAVHV